MLNQDDLNDAILSSARSIAQATHSLIVCAERAQAKRGDDGTDPASKYNVDPTWANGLISAAQSVASSVKTLVGASNASVEGKAQEAALVASARAVAQSTAHLVAASKAKSDPFSREIMDLSEAAKTVATTTSSLVEAAHAAAKVITLVLKSLMCFLVPRGRRSRRCRPHKFHWRTFDECKNHGTTNEGPKNRSRVTKGAQSLGQHEKSQIPKEVKEPRVSRYFLII